MGHFTVVCSVAWPLTGSEARTDLVLIQTSLFLLRKLSCSNASQGINVTKAKRSLSKQPRCHSKARKMQVTEQRTVKRSKADEQWRVTMRRPSSFNKLGLKGNIILLR